MINHAEVERYSGTMAELAGDLGNLRYDALAAFLRHLAEKLPTTAGANAGRGRHILASKSQGSAAGLTMAADEMERAWLIRAPHM